MRNIKSYTYLLFFLLCVMPEIIWAQRNTKTISGKVLFENDKEPIPGVTVWLKNTSNGTITDINGDYKITVKEEGTLVFSFLGMKTLEVPINNRSVINVTMVEDTETIDEVVIVGYGEQKKESVVGSISSLDPAKLVLPSSSLSNALAGQLAGVVAMSRSGEPGRASNAEFYIRGISSFAGNRSPLVLVDGIERSMDLVDVEDIESFSILKDAAASAVYGMRGANGVILITTRKGQKGKAKINVRGEYSLTSPTKTPEFINSVQWADLYNEAYRRTNFRDFYSPEAIEMYKNGTDPDLYPDIDWYHSIFKDQASSQRITANISGGSEMMDYYISGGMYNEGSIFRSATDIYDYDSSVRYSKFNFRANLNFTLTKTTKLNVNLSNIYEKSFAPGADKDQIYERTVSNAPNLYPLEYSNGQLAGPSNVGSGINPWNLLVHSGYSEQFWNSSQSLIGLTQDLDFVTKGLTANVKFSWDAFNTTRQWRTKEAQWYYAAGRDPQTGELITTLVNQGSSELGYGESREGTMTTYLEASLNYNRLFGEKHRVGAMFLYNHKILTKTGNVDKYTSLPYKNQGIAGRLTYAFKDKYLAEFNIGYNGSENFAPGHRFGLFPAGAIGWVVSSEPWYGNVSKVVNFLKLRGSYGVVGNDGIGDGKRWIYQSTIVGGGGFSYGIDGNSGAGGITIGDIENLDVSWEKAYKADAGIEFQLFNMIRVQADYFHEMRKGIFITRNSLPAITGLSTNPRVNIGEAKNQGMELSLEYAQNFTKDLYVTFRGNFSYAHNTLLNEDKPDYKYKYQNRTGKSINTRYGLVCLGLFQSEEEVKNSPVQTFSQNYGVGDRKYQDINGDGVIDDNDQVAIGFSSLPEITYGFGATAQWKGFDLNIFFQGVARVDQEPNGLGIRPFASDKSQAGILKQVYENIWRENNTPEQNAKAVFPRASMGYDQNNFRTSTATIYDASFMRLKNLEIGYTIPRKLLSKINFVESLRFYLSANNLLTFTKFKFWDPEIDSGNGGKYPTNRVLRLGLSANF